MGSADPAGRVRGGRLAGGKEANRAAPSGRGGEPAIDIRAQEYATTIERPKQGPAYAGPFAVCLHPSGASNTDSKCAGNHPRQRSDTPTCQYATLAPWPTTR